MVLVPSDVSDLGLAHAHCASALIFSSLPGKTELNSGISCHCIILELRIFLNT